MPNESFKIKISGGSIFFVTVAEIQKISKEAAPVQNSNNPYFHDSEYSWGQGFHHYMRETSHLPAYMKKHRFYRTIEFRPGINNIGLRIVRGFSLTTSLNLVWVSDWMVCILEKAFHGARVYMIIQT